MPAEQRKDIRIRMRRLRRDLDPTDRADAAAALCARLTDAKFFQSARHIAAYLPNDGEIDTWPVIRHARDEGKSVYLPVVMANDLLGFAPLTADAQLHENRYGIPEPRCSTGEMKAAKDLDLVLLPLVAFDDTLYRLGMGKGYYDRTFSFVGDTGKMRPQLVGIGYDFQRVETVYAQHWDVPAWRIVTDNSIYKQVHGK